MATAESDGKAAGTRTATSTQAAPATATTACTSSSSRRPPACSSGPPASAAARIPQNCAALATEMAAVRWAGGKYRAATLVVAFSTSGWPADSTTWPARIHAYELGPASRSSAPAAVSSAPADRARPNRRSSQRPAGSASSTYISGLMTARSPMAPSDTPRA